MAVCLIVTLPGIPLNFDTPSQSFRVKHSLTVILIVVLADSPLNFDTSAKVKIIARECISAESPIKNLIWADLEESRAEMVLGRNDPELVL